MNKLNVIVGIFVICFLSCTESNQETKTEKEIVVDNGAEIYKKRCVSCHGMDGKLGFAGAKDLGKSILPLTMIEIQVTQGKGAMNGFIKILTEEEIKNVSEYAFKFRERI